ncbi:MAG: signal peptidase I [Turicibacter sp.]|nr:signal peptidase I [Turicibacter sp.]
MKGYTGSEFLENDTTSEEIIPLRRKVVPLRREVTSLRSEELKFTRKPTPGQEVTSWIKTICLTMIVVILIRRFIFMAVEVNGASMEPTFLDGQRVIVWQFFYSPNLFDVVVLEHTDGQHHIKRVLGAPGDRVDYIEGHLFINEQLVEEPYIMQEPSANGFTLEEICQFVQCGVIPDGYFLVLGDHRNRSGDSREYGLVHESQILGRVVMRFWPFEDFSLSPN